MRDTRQDYQTTAASQAHDIVTREGSDLDQALRARGWRVRSGWRSTHRGERVWLVRLVCPAGSWVEPALPESIQFGLAA
jgi:hypothetical protein